MEKGIVDSVPAWLILDSTAATLTSIAHPGWWLYGAPEFVSPGLLSDLN